MSSAQLNGELTLVVLTSNGTLHVPGSLKGYTEVKRRLLSAQDALANNPTFSWWPAAMAEDGISPVLVLIYKMYCKALSCSLERLQEVQGLGHSPDGAGPFITLNDNLMCTVDEIEMITRHCFCTDSISRCHEFQSQDNLTLASETA